MEGKKMLNMSQMSDLDATLEDIKNKNLLIDSSFFGIEGTARLIAEIAKSKFGK